MESGLRIGKEIEEKEGLLQDVEQITDLKLFPATHHKEVLLRVKDYQVIYEDSQKFVFQNLSFQLRQGERIFIQGENGCGKSTLIKAILKSAKMEQEVMGGCFKEQGTLETASGLVIS